MVVGGGDGSDHADHQAGLLVDDRTAAESLGQIVGTGQLQQLPLPSPSAAVSVSPTMPYPKCPPGGA